MWSYGVFNGGERGNLPCPLGADKIIIGYPNAKCDA